MTKVRLRTQLGTETAPRLQFIVREVSPIREGDDVVGVAERGLGLTQLHRRTLHT